MGQLALPFLAFSIFAMVVWVAWDKRAQDRRDVAALDNDASTPRRPKPPYATRR